MSYSQNGEDKIFLDYFKGKRGNLLDIGANDGKTLSNSLALIEKGWLAVLVEPDADAFDKLSILHDQNDKVFLYRFAIAEEDGEMDFYKSGTHLNAGDTGLLSTTVTDDYFKWRSSTTFEQTTVNTLRFDTFLDACPIKTFDFITIDAEGQDFNILGQMDLAELGCKMVCVEHNGVKVDRFIDYCEKFGMKTVHMNSENLIMAL